MKRVLLVVDMQVDFVTGVMKSEVAKEIIPSIVKLCDKFAASNDAIVFTKDTHMAGCEYFPRTIEGKLLPLHCEKFTQGWEIVPELRNYADIVIEKSSFMMMESEIPANAQDALNSCDEIVVCGTRSDICVISNALFLACRYPDKQITIVADACSGLTGDKHMSALDVAGSCLIKEQITDNIL